MNKGIFESTNVCTSQYGNLSPLLSNIMQNGLDKEIANLGDHYQFITTKSVITRSILKEKLTKRGLIRILAYYQKVVNI